MLNGNTKLSGRAPRPDNKFILQLELSQVGRMVLVSRPAHLPTWGDKYYLQKRGTHFGTLGAWKRISVGYRKHGSRKKKGNYTPPSPW
jgi:hypothetical protein